MATIKSKRRSKDRINVQIHFRIPKPRGMSLSPELVRELAEDWVNGESLPYGKVDVVAWDFQEGKRKGKVLGNASSGADSNQEIRETIIRRIVGMGLKNVWKKGNASRPRVQQFEDMDE